MIRQTPYNKNNESKNNSEHSANRALPLSGELEGASPLPSEGLGEVSLHQHVRVRVVEVDMRRKRLPLSMKNIKQ